MTTSRIDKTGKWKYHKLAVGESPEFAKAVIDNTLHLSCAAVSTVETRIADMMISSKEYRKAKQHFKGDDMGRETINVEINNKQFQAEVGYEISDGVITDINTLFVIVDDLHRNIDYLIEPLKEGIVEDITDILKGRT